MRNLRNVADEELAELYGNGDEAMQAAVLAEATRRDRKSAQTARDKARWAAVHAEWQVWAHAQFTAAENETRGYLLNREGVAAGMEPWSLWTGSLAHAMRYASEELQEFWTKNPRLTVSAFREELRKANR